MPNTASTYTFELSMLPSTFYASEVEVAFLCRCMDVESILTKPFKIHDLAKIANEMRLSKKDHVGLFQGLSRHGIIYTFSNHASSEYINEDVDYFVNAEKLIQSVINRFPEYVIGRRLCKFDMDGTLHDGGFITKESEVFNIIMRKIDAFYGHRENRNSYLPGFIRLYECVGTADGRDFFTKRSATPVNITSPESPIEPKFTIPKYATLERKNNTNIWVPKNQSVNVCIS